MADPIKITELVEAPSDLNPESWLEVVDIEDVDEDSSGTSKKIKVKNLSSGGISNFDATKDYSIDDVVIFNNVLYQANEAIIGDDSGFDDTKWNEIYIDRLLTSDVTLKGTSLGALETGDTITAGTLEEVINQLATKELNPTKTAPSIDSFSITPSGTIEVGESITVTVTASINEGTLSEHEATDDGNTVATGNGTDFFDMANFKLGQKASLVSDNSAPFTTDVSISSIEEGITDSQIFEGELTWSDGDVPLTNSGNPFPSAQVKADSSPDTDSKSIRGRYKIFYGSQNSSPSGSDLSTLSSNDSVFDNTDDITFDVTDEKYIFAVVPKGGDANLLIKDATGNFTSVSNTKQSNTPSTTNYKNDGGSGGYTLYYWVADGTFGGEFKITL